MSEIKIIDSLKNNKEEIRLKAKMLMKAMHYVHRYSLEYFYPGK